MVVLFPAPFGPKNPTTSPLFIEKFIEFTATLLPNVLVTFSTKIFAFLFSIYCFNILNRIIFYQKFHNPIIYFYILNN